MATSGAFRGLLSKSLRELRIHYCQTSPSSAGVRDFVRAHFQEMKQANPTLPILVRECRGIQPSAAARFQLGQERSVALSNMSKPQTMTAIQQLVESGSKL